MKFHLFNQQICPAVRDESTSSPALQSNELHWPVKYLHVNLEDAG